MGGEGEEDGDDRELHGIRIVIKVAGVNVIVDSRDPTGEIAIDDVRGLTDGGILVVDWVRDYNDDETFAVDEQTFDVNDEKFDVNDDKFVMNDVRVFNVDKNLLMNDVRVLNVDKN
ncbi:MAG TPA: hypothetical protein VNN08_21755 [Thermoanaerobaculia bacterium]|nr:hypothetical protein [Thermoanaerobaculia bacterium]